MAGNDENVNLLISAAVEGLQNVESLISDLQELEKSGSKEIPDATGELREGINDTAQAMEGLAGKLSKLKKQQALVTQFAELKKQTQDLAKEQAAAKKSATQLGKSYASLENPTKAQARAFEESRKASRSADVAYESNQKRLNALRTDLEQAGVSTKDLAGEQVRIRKELSGVNDEAKGLSRELTSVRDSAKGAAESTEKAAKGTKKLGDQAGRSQGLIGKLGGVLRSAGQAATVFTATAAASIATLTLFSRKQGEAARNINNTSEALGINAQRLQEFQAAGRQFNIEGDKTADILKDITEKVGDFSATGGGEAADVFKKLNLSIEDFRNLSPDQQIIKLSESITQLDSQSEKVFFLESLSNDASLLLPLLDDNAKALRQISKEAQASGAILTDKELADLTKANSIYNDIDLKLKGLVNRIGVQLAPVVADATEKVLKLFNDSGGADKLIGVFKRLTTAATEFFEQLVTKGSATNESFQSLVDTVQFLGNGITAVFRTVQTAGGVAVTFVAATLANFLTLASKVTKGLAAIGVVSEESFRKIQAKADAANSTVNSLVEQTAEYGRQAQQAGIDAANAFDNTEKSAKKAGEETKRAGEEVGTLLDGIKPLAGDAETALNDQESAAKGAREELRDMGVDVNKAFTGISTGAKKALNELGNLPGLIKKVGAGGETAANIFQQKFQAAFEAASTDAELTALKEKVRGLGKDADVGSSEVVQALDKIKQKQQEINGQQVDQSLDDAGDSAENAEKQVQKVKEKTEETGEEAEKAREKFRNAFGSYFAQILGGARMAVTQLSDAARNLFETKIGSNQFVNQTESVTESLERATNKVQELQSKSALLRKTSLAGWANDTALASATVQREFFRQAKAAEELKARIDEGTYSLDGLNSVANQAANEFSLLDKQRLDGLRSAIDAARSKIESLNESADSTLNSLRQRLADIKGDTEEAQRLQYEADRKRLQEQLAQARKAGADNAAADYSKALDQLSKINAIEQKNRREQENERERAAAERERQQEQAERERQQAKRDRQQSSAPARTAPASPGQTIVLQTPGGGQTQVQTTDPDGLLSILEQAGLRSAQ